MTKFACQHKVPIQRSAFTFCEDDIPSGLDLGKAKYGGPFSTEQVEHVKAFYGILKVLFALVPVFFLQVPGKAYVVCIHYLNFTFQQHFRAFVWVEFRMSSFKMHLFFVKLEK